MSLQLLVLWYEWYDAQTYLPQSKLPIKCNCWKLYAEPVSTTILSIMTSTNRVRVSLIGKNAGWTVWIYPCLSGTLKKEGQLILNTRLGFSSTATMEGKVSVHSKFLEISWQYSNAFALMLCRQGSTLLCCLASRVSLPQTQVQFKYMSLLFRPVLSFSVV